MDEVLEELAQEITVLWRKLGRRLKIKEAVLDAIHKEKEEYCEKAYSMLLKWKRANGKEATFLVLFNALCHGLVNRRDVAEKICCGDHE